MLLLRQVLLSRELWGPTGFSLHPPAPVLINSKLFMCSCEEKPDSTFIHAPAATLLSPRHSFLTSNPAVVRLSLRDLQWSFVKGFQRGAGIRAHSLAQRVRVLNILLGVALPSYTHTHEMLCLRALFCSILGVSSPPVPAPQVTCSSPASLPVPWTSSSWNAGRQKTSWVSRGSGGCGGPSSAAWGWEDT